MAIEFFTVPTATFGVLFGFLVLAHDRRRVLHFNVTANPTAEWTARQGAGLSRGDCASVSRAGSRPDYGGRFRRVLEILDVAEVVTAVRSPWQNAYAERLIGSLRRECLDHVVVLGEIHLLRILAEYFEYNRARCLWLANIAFHRELLTFSVEAVVIVKPETVIGWHRSGFSLHWRWLSKRGRSPGRAPVGREVRDLVRRMARENRWGAPRIHGELLKLGFMVSERTVSRYMRSHGRSPERRQSWLTFLRNHREVIVAMDFFTVPTAAVRVLYVWFAIRHSRREIVHWSVTETPTSSWVVQQLREVFPFDDAGGRSRYLVCDRDTIFSAAVVAAIASMGLEPTRTSYQSPWQNGVAERFVGTVRRDLLDHAIVLDDEHLRRLLSEYLAYYHVERTHLGIEKDAPVARPVELRPAGAAAVHAQRRVGGLHHRCVWAAAA